MCEAKGKTGAGGAAGDILQPLRLKMKCRVPGHGFLRIEYSQ